MKNTDHLIGKWMSVASLSGREHADFIIVQAYPPRGPPSWTS